MTHKPTQGQCSEHSHDGESGGPETIVFGDDGIMTFFVDTDQPCSSRCLTHSGIVCSTKYSLSMVVEN